MKILLAIDGSDFARAAERLLAEFPWDVPPQLTILFVAQLPMADVSDVFEDSCEWGQRLLVEASSRCEQWAGSVERRMMSGGAARAIVVVAESTDVDLIVMGARGLGNAGRFLLGSTSDTVAKTATCSVLVVKGHAAETSGAVNSILIAGDESLPSRAALGRFSKLPLGSARKVTLLSVLEDVSSRYSRVDLSILEETYRVRREKLAEWLEETRRPMLQRIPQVDARVHEAINVADDILATAAEVQADLIVLGSTGMSGWKRLMLGSVSLRVLHHASCSVWIERLKPVIPASGSVTAVAEEEVMNAGGRVHP